MTVDDNGIRRGEYQDPAVRPGARSDSAVARPVPDAQPAPVARPVDRGSNSDWGWIAAIVAVLIVLGLAAIFFFDRGDRLGQAQEPVGATVGVLGADTAAFEGRPVEVTGRVVTMLGRRAFLLGGLGAQVTPGAAGLPATGVLVVSPRPLEPLMANNVVQVVGTVRRFDQRTIEQELGADLVGAPGTIFAQWAGRPVIVATAIAPAG